MPIRIPNLGASSSGRTLQGVSPSDATAHALSMKSVAKGVQDISGAIAETDERIMRVQNAADLTEITTRMKSAHADFMQGLAEDHDYTGYGKKWDKHLESMQKEIFGGKYSKYVLDEARRRFEAFKGDSRIDVARAAQNRAIKRAGIVYGEARRKAYETGDRSFLEGAGADNPYILPERHKAELDQYDSHMRYRDAESAVESDPLGELPDIEAGKGDYAALPQHDRQKLARRAKTRARQLKAEALQLIQTKVQTGEIKTELDFVRVLEGHPDIDEDTAKIMLKRWRADKPMTKEQRLKIQGKLDSLQKTMENPGSDRGKYLDKFFDLQAEIETWGAEANHLRSQLTGLSVKKFDDFRAAKEDKRMVSVRAFTRDEISKSEELDTYDADDINKHMRKYLKDFPDAGSEDVRREHMRYMAVKQTEGAASILSGSAPKKKRGYFDLPQVKTGSDGSVLPGLTPPPAP